MLKRYGLWITLPAGLLKGELSEDQYLAKNFYFRAFELDHLRIIELIIIIF